MEKFVAFNSTRYIRNQSLEEVDESMHLAFNSTRYIRNLQNRKPYLYVFALSTPHGTLGTVFVPSQENRYRQLSTPHGTLGTELVVDVNNDVISFNSTRYIRNTKRPH